MIKTIKAKLHQRRLINKLDKLMKQVNLKASGDLIWLYNDIFNIVNYNTLPEVIERNAYDMLYTIEKYLKVYGYRKTSKV